MNSRKHFDWAVGRATQYLKVGNTMLAMASLTSDLNQCEGTRNILTPDLLGLMLAESQLAGVEGVRKFIAALPAPADDTEIPREARNVWE